MRHRKKGKKLGRTSTHRKQTLQALSNALIEHKRITTTLPKAKALRPFVEPLITRAKDDTEHNRRQVFRYLQNKQAVRELFGEVSDRVGDRPGGYTRIIQAGRRSGDGAELALVELVDFNDVPPADQGGGGSRTRRGSGKGRREESSTESTASESTASESAETQTPESQDAEGTETAEGDAADADAAEADADAQEETGDEPKKDE